MPLGKYILADNAYVIGKHLLTLFFGVDRTDTEKDAFNYYVLQLRQTVERAFGAKVTKWQILLLPLASYLCNVGMLIMCIGSLHNFCIDESKCLNGVPDEMCLPYNFLDYRSDEGIIYLLSTCLVTNIEGNLMLRKFLVKKILDMGLTCPKVTRLTK